MFQLTLQLPGLQHQTCISFTTLQTSGGKQDRIAYGREMAQQYFFLAIPLCYYF